MTIHRKQGRIIIECDGCYELFEGEKGDEFASVWNSAKEHGWRAEPVFSQWMHECKACARKRR